MVVRDVGRFSTEEVAPLLSYLEDPLPTTVLVLVAGGGQVAPKLAAAVKARGHVLSTKVAPTRGPGLDSTADPAAPLRMDGQAEALIEAHLGEDVSRLGALLDVLVAAYGEADTEGPITPEVVNRYYDGRAEVTSFQVADLAMEGKTSEALKQLRFALACGVAPVLVTSALANGLRSIGRVASAPRGTRPADLARDLGMPPWKVDVVRRQLRGWTGTRSRWRSRRWRSPTARSRERAVPATRATPWRRRS